MRIVGFELFFCPHCDWKAHEEQRLPGHWLPADLTVVARRSYRKGEAIQFPYARTLSSHESLLRYGFVSAARVDDDRAIVTLPQSIVARAVRARAGRTVELSEVDDDDVDVDVENWPYVRAEQSPHAVEPPPSNLCADTIEFLDVAAMGRETIGFVFKRDVFGVGYYVDDDRCDDTRRIVVESIVPGDMCAIRVRPVPVASAGRTRCPRCAPRRAATRDDCACCARCCARVRTRSTRSAMRRPARRSGSTIANRHFCGRRSRRSTRRVRA